jgi:predicted PurR-regulated permease PerM
MILKLPFYAKAIFIAIGIYVIISMLYIAQGIIMPLVFGTILAVLLHPIVRFFEKLKFNRIIAISITILLSIVSIAAIGLFIYSQLITFSDSWPIFVERFTDLLNQTILWIPGYFDISALKVNTWIAETKIKLLDSSGLLISQTLLSVGSTLVVVFIIPIYIFLILFYKPLFIDFLHQLFANEKQEKVTIIITQTKSVIQRYLVGLVLETVLVALLNSAGLLILGIDYAILIGILGALLNLIPYIGGLVAVAIPMMIAFVTKDSPLFAFYVLGIYYSIQLFDNNFIVPKIVASKVRINALVSIVVVFAGGAIWGVSGMFLSIPIIAIVKVVCDHIESLKPWGMLLGDKMPKVISFKLMKLKNKH